MSFVTRRTGRMSDDGERHISGLLRIAAEDVGAVAELIKLLHASILCMSGGDLLFYGQQYITLLPHFLGFLYYNAFVSAAQAVQFVNNAAQNYKFL